MFFKEIYGLEGVNLSVVENLLRELSEDKDNMLYHEGLLALDKFSDKHLAPIGKKGWTARGHAGVEGLSDAEILKEKYGHLPELEVVINGLFESAPRMK